MPALRTAVGGATLAALAAGVVLAGSAAAAPAPSDSADTTLTTSVNTILSLTAPSSIDFGPLDVGATSDVEDARVSVVSNVSEGYQLAVARSAFARSDRDIPVDVVVPKPELADTGVDVEPGTAVAVPTSGGALNLAHRKATITAEEGDAWSLGLRLGPVPFTQDGLHSSTVTFTAVGL